MYVVGKTWCHDALDDTTEKKEYDNYEDAKVAYDRAVKNEQYKTHVYGYKRSERFFTQNPKEESTVFTDDNIHIDRNDYNFCEVFLYECSIQKGGHR